jgi:hypothetical protein
MAELSERNLSLGEGRTLAGAPLQPLINVLDQTASGCQSFNNHYPYIEDDGKTYTLGDL